MAALIHLSEGLVHGVDLAITMNRTDLVDQQLCQDLLAHIRQVDMDAFRRPSMFAPETSAPESASTHVRLLAFLDRHIYATRRRTPARRRPAFCGRPDPLGEPLHRLRPAG